MTTFFKKSAVLALMALGVLALAAAPAMANLIQNGSFEEDSSVYIGGALNQPANSSDITGWDIVITVDWVGTYYAAAAGYRSIDMSASHSYGDIKQTVTVSPNTTYVITFAVAGITNATPYLKTMDVKIDGVTKYQASYTATKEAAQLTSDDWVDETFTFTTGASQTSLVLEFIETSDGNAGMALDNVRMDVVPIPASAFLLGSGLMGLGLMGWRRKNS